MIVWKITHESEDGLMHDYIIRRARAWRDATRATSSGRSLV